MVASVADPTIAAAMRARPETPFDVMRASVASELVARRRRVAASLAGAGVGLVDAAPEALPAACVRAYMRLKARARV